MTYTDNNFYNFSIIVINNRIKQILVFQKISLFLL
jgi:hypothetical protein